jgi:hypothetical protein
MRRPFHGLAVALDERTLANPKRGRAATIGSPGRLKMFAAQGAPLNRKGRETDLDFITLQGEAAAWTFRHLGCAP